MSLNHVCAVPEEAQKRALDHLELKLIVSHMWVLGPEPRSSVRTVMLVTTEPSISPASGLFVCLGGGGGGEFLHSPGCPGPL